MRPILSMSVAALVCFLGVSLANEAYSDPGIAWRNGDVESTATDTSGVSGRLIAIANSTTERHLIVQLAPQVDYASRQALRASGLTLLSSLGNQSFFASVDADADIEQIASALSDAYAVKRDWKMHRIYSAGTVPVWSVVSEGLSPPDTTRVAAYVVFHRDVTIAPEGLAALRRHDATVRAIAKSVNMAVVELPLLQLPSLASEDIVQWIEPPLPRMAGINDDNRTITGADTVQQAPYGLTGEGVTVLVYDAGTARSTHRDFSGRLTVGDSSGLNDHPTHVACTIGGDGSASGGTYRGMAPGVDLLSYGLEWDGSGIFLYTNPVDLESDYLEAITSGGADLANNSIGTNTCWNFFPCSITGDYGVTSALIDAIVAGSLGDPFRIIWANGNERSCTTCPSVHQNGYYSTAPPAGAKNHIAVGAVNSNDDSQTEFSSWGPVDDGRIKPDLVAPGCQSIGDFGVTSCSALTDSSYLSACGTSMAAPTVTGLAALVLEEFRNTFPMSNDPRNSTLKSLFAHTAADIGPAGPDYQSGYGSVRVQATIDYMRENNSHNFFEAEVAHGNTQGYMARVVSTDLELRVTLAWDDVPGTPNVIPSLVNDLDLRVYDPSGARHYPWTLDPANPSADAVRIQSDHVNNIEQVVVAIPQPGVWTIEVEGFDVPEGPQSFSLSISPIILSDCDDNGTPDDEQIASDPSLDCSGNGLLDSCEPDCDSDGLADSCEIFAGTSQDCNSNGVPDDCEPPTDCNANGIQDICDLASGLSTDCNRNDLLDICDLAAGTSDDCNNNQLPDECDPDADCNQNGAQDICDISAGISEDCNENLVPDDCDLYDCGDPTGVCGGTGDCCDLAGNGSPGCDCPRCCSAVCDYDSFCCTVEWDSICAWLAVRSSECDCGGFTGSSDCNLNVIPDECDIADGSSIDCNSNEIPDECDTQADCNVNGVQDICDIASGTSDDCNLNDVPDECEPQEDCNGNGLQDICDLAGGGSGDCNLNEIPDECDLAGGLSNDCNFNDTPDECDPQADCNDNGELDICDLADGTSADCNQNSRPDECDIYDCGQPTGSCPGSGSCCKPSGNGSPGCECSRCCAAVCAIDSWCCNYPWDSWCAFIASVLPDCDCGGSDQDWSEDCNANEIPDECDLADGTSYDCNSNDVPDECDPDEDCNGNGVQDICDVAFGNSEDCNANEVPDECDTDCNGNSIPDDCDLSDGTSDDCNANGIPDECDPQEDCNGNGVQDICDVAWWTSPDCDHNGVPDECDPDCNGSGVPDSCDVLPLDSSPVDGCTGANRICPGLEFSGVTVGATTDGSSSCGNSDASPDIWYFYIPPTDGNASVFLCGSPYDTVLSVHTGCPGDTSNEVACNDDICGWGSRVDLPVTAGVRYLIRVTGRSGATGLFMLKVVGPGNPAECGPTSSDCNGNLMPDECDVTSGVSADCNSNGIPDICDVPPISGGNDCNNNLVPDECEGDCQPNGVFDPCDISSGFSNDCNSNGLPDECDLSDELSADCNENGIPDECDIYSCGPASGSCPGTGNCCMANNTPGCDCSRCCQAVCEIMPSCCSDTWNYTCVFFAEQVEECNCGGPSQGWSQDCNTNDIPDECDIASGTEADCSLNGVPDACEVDTDEDGVVDSCDECPQDSNKIFLGQCGCGMSDSDLDGDTVADCVDDDLDNDGVLNEADISPFDPFACEDVDGDGCDDCSVGTDGLGPESDNDPFNDGLDFDGDGICGSEGIVPTVSSWGLAALILLILAGARILYARKANAKASSRA